MLVILVNERVDVEPFWERLTVAYKFHLTAALFSVTDKMKLHLMIEAVLAETKDRMLSYVVILKPSPDRLTGRELNLARWAGLTVIE